MRVGLALSSIVHLAVLLVAYLAFASPRLFDPRRPKRWRSTSCAPTR